MKKEKKNILDEDDDSSGTTASSYQEILFTPIRDDLLDQPLTADDERLLLVHQSRQAGHVEEARRDSLERAQRNQQIANSVMDFGSGLRGQAGPAGKVKQHPLLHKKASCVDEKVSPRPDESKAQANPELQNKLAHQHRLSLNAQPSSAPTLRRS